MLEADHVCGSTHLLRSVVSQLSDSERMHHRTTKLSEPWVTVPQSDPGGPAKG